MIGQVLHRSRTEVEHLQAPGQPVAQVHRHVRPQPARDDPALSVSLDPVEGDAGSPCQIDDSHAVGIAQELRHGVPVREVLAQQRQATLITRAKGIADKRNDASIGDSDWAVYVNWGVRTLYKFLVSLDPGIYFSQADFTLTATAAGAVKDLSTLTWPANGSTPAGGFKALHGIDLNPDTSQRRTIRRRNFIERNAGVRIGWWTPTTYADDRAYDLRGRTLVLTPYELAAGSYRAYARQKPYEFTSEADGNPLDWQLEDASDEFICDMAARRALNIEESDTQFNSGRLQEIKQELTDEHQRDNGEATRIADVEAEDPAWQRGI